MSNLTELQRRCVEMMMESGECECGAEPFQICEEVSNQVREAYERETKRFGYYIDWNGFDAGYRAALQDKCKTDKE